MWEGIGGARNKGQEPCRDFQEGKELRLEETKEDMGESLCRSFYKWNLEGKDGDRVLVGK